MSVKLGDKVTDSVSGFTGIAIARISYITGCDQITVQAKSEDNRPPHSMQVDEDRLLASVRDLALMKHGSEVTQGK